MNPPKGSTYSKGDSPRMKRYHESSESESKKRKYCERDESEGVERFQPRDDKRSSGGDADRDGDRKIYRSGDFPHKKTISGKSKKFKSSPRKSNYSFNSSEKSELSSTPSQDRLRRLISKKPKQQAVEISNETVKKVVSADGLDCLNMSSTPAQERLKNLLKNFSRDSERSTEKEKPVTNTPKEKSPLKVTITEEAPSVRLNEASERGVSPVKSVSSDPEDMDWSPIPLPVIDSVVKQSREIELVHASVEPSCGWIETDRFCLVVDTNVLLSSLSLVKEAMDISLNGLQVVVVIPWQVLCELDHIKSLDSVTASRARAASVQLAQLSRRRLPSLWLQPPFHHREQVENFSAEIPDDYIILCALQLKKSGCLMSLITFDNNLSVKAEAAGVSTMSEHAFLKLFNKKQPPKVALLDLPPVDSSPVAQMTHNLCKELNYFLHGLVQNGLQRTYGKEWLMHVPSQPPWSLCEALRALRSSWDFVSSSRTPPASLTSIEHFLSSNNYSTVTKDVLTKFAGECCSLASNTIKDSKQHSYLFMSKVMDYLKDTDTFTKISIVTAQFECFRQRVISFAGAMFRLLNRSWPDHMPVPQELPEINAQLAEKQLEFTTLVLKNVIEGLHMLNRVKGEISETHRCVPVLHSNVCKFLDNRTTQLEEYVYFCNSRQVRSTVDQAINQFDQLLQLLTSISR